MGRTTKGNGRVSQSDVARLAAVSTQTVSRVANGLTNVDAATRDRVLAAMTSLGYRPNSAARALRLGRFGSIGVIMFTLATHGNMKTLDAVATAAGEAGYSITLMPVPTATQSEVTGAFGRLTDQDVDGIIILIEAHILDRGDIALPDGVPVVIVDSDAGERYAVVDTDQAQGARIATEHLLDLGHRTVFHIAGPASSFSSERRTASWRAVLAERGAPMEEPLVGDWTVDSGYAHGRALAERDDVTAVFCANDQMALGLMRAMHEHGRSVPGSLSVVGFDDMPEARAFWPPLTTVHQDFSEVGRRSMKALIDEIEGRGQAGTSIVPVHLVARESTAAPAR
jgi:DNA-binding LacI/PurR family transcriptional regulator